MINMNKKKISIIIIAIAIVLIAIGTVLSFTKKEAKTGKQENNSLKNATYKVNEEITINKLKIKLSSSSEFNNYTKCYDNTDDVEPKDSFNDNCLDVADNQKIQKFTFSLESLVDNQLINTTKFKCIADDKEYNQVYGFDEREFAYLLNTGDKETGNIYCQIPKAASNVKIQYVTNNAEIYFES